MAGADAMPLPENICEKATQLTTGLSNAGTMVANTQVASDPFNGVPGWIGESADAYTDSVRKLGEHARTLAGQFAPVITAVENWSAAVKNAIDKTVPGLQAEYDEAEHIFEINLILLNADIIRKQGTVFAYSADEILVTYSKIAKAHEDVQNDILDRYRKAMDALDQEAQNAANAVQAAQDAVVDPSCISTRDQIGSTLFNDIPLVDGQAEWEYAQEVAISASRIMKDSDLTYEELQDFYNKYGAMLSNPFFANALSEHLTPQEMLEFSISAAFIPTDDNDQMRDYVVKQIGAAIILASGGMNTADPASQIAFETAKRGLTTESGSLLPQQIKNFNAALVSAGRATYKPSELSHYSVTNISDVDGYEVMSQIIGEAGAANPGLSLGPEFFETPEGGRSVAQDMVVWDAEKMTWATERGYRDSIQMFSSDNRVMCDSMHAAYTLMDRPDGLDPSTSDPILVAADQARSKGIREFLASNTPTGMDVNHDGQVDASDTPINMTRYLTGGRTSVTGDGYHGFQDSGEQFGKIIAEASVPDMNADMRTPHSADYPGGTSDPDYIQAHEAYEALKKDDLNRATIAANFMAGYQDGLDVDNDTSIFTDGDSTESGEDVYGHQNSALRSWAGTIIAPHLDGLAISMDPSIGYDETGASEQPDDRAVMRFTSNDIYRFIAKGGIFEDLAFDNPAVIDAGDPNSPLDDVYENGRRPALYTLRMAAREGYVQDLAAANNADIGTDMQIKQYENANAKWAPLTNSLYVAPANAQEAAVQAMEDRNEAWKSGIGRIIDAVPYSDLIDNKVTQYAIGQLKGDALQIAEGFIFSSPAPGISDANHAHLSTLAGQEMYSAMLEALTNSPSDHWTLSDGTPIDFSDESFADYADGEGHLLNFTAMNNNTRNSFRTFVNNGTAFTSLSSDLNQQISIAETLRRKANEEVTH